MRVSFFPPLFSSHPLLTLSTILPLPVVVFLILITAVIVAIVVTIVVAIASLSSTM